MEEEYLEEGFDPSTLKVAKLRGALFDHNVHFPSNAKKPELVELFYKHIAVSPKEPVLVEDVDSDDDKKVKKSRKSRKSKKEKIENTPETDDKETSKLSAKSEEPPIVVKNTERVSKKKKNRKTSKSMTKELVEEKLEKEGKSQNEETDVSKSIDTAIAKPENSTPVKVNNSATEVLAQNSAKGEKTTETPQKQKQTAETSYVASTASKSRKRKSMLDEVDLKISATPSKGNIFDVDSDSEPEILSSKRKKPKHASEALISSSPKSPSLLKKSISDLEKSKDEDKETIPAAANVTFESIKTLEPENNNASTPEQKRVAHLENSIQPPVLKEIEEIVYNPPSTETSTVISDSTEEPSIWFKTQQSFEVPETGPENVFFGNSAASASHSFDSALSKLKRETQSEDILSPGGKKEELARLLNIDVNSITPKPKSRRSITPRRPIIIPQALLTRSSEKKPVKVDTSIAPEDELSSDDDNEEEEKEEENEGNESVETIVEASKKPKSKQVKEKKHIQRPSVSKTISYLFLWLSLVGVLFFGYWYREQTFLVGYCGQEINRPTIPETPETSDFLISVGQYLDDHYKPACVECPQHARCFPRLEIACYDDFVVSAPWYYSYLPNFNLKAQKCIPDTKKAEKIEIMIDVALDLLRARNANVNCGRSDKDDISAGLEISELHDLLLALKAPYITEEEFEELWDRSVVELEKEPEIIVRYTNHLITPAVDDNNTVTETYYASPVFRSTSLSHIGFKCLMSNTVVTLALRFKRTLLVIALVSVIIYACYWKFQQYKFYTHKIDTLYQEVLNKLKRQAKLGRGSSELPEFVGSVQLRDLILSNEPNIAYKMRLWQAVSHKVDRNTNVKHELLEVHGEVMKVWQWISNAE